MPEPVNSTLSSSAEESSDDDRGGPPGGAGAVVAVGRIGKAHGVRGDAFVEPWTDTPEERFVPGAVLLAEPADRGPLIVAAARDHSGKLVVHFEGVDSRNAIEAIRGTVLTVPAAARPVIDDPDEFYDTDLIGLAVRTVAGQDLGPVTDVLHSPAGSLLAIEVAGREVLLPFRAEFVPTIDLDAGIAEVELPDGLLEL